MVIYGMSQSSGVERRLGIEGAGRGISLAIYDHAGGEERDRIVVSAEELLAAVTGGSDSGASIEGVGKWLDLKVRRNEVQIKTRAEAGGEWDVAVGLDDFQDALEAIMGAA